MENLIGFIFAGFALTGSPGPATLSIAAAAAAFGASRSVAFTTGIVIGVTMVMVITASGVTGLVLALPGAAPVVATLAAAYMIYLAFRIATAPPLSKDAGDGQAPSLVGGIFLALANPKAYAAMAALYSGFVLILHRPEVDAAVKTGILVVIITLVNIAWLLVGAALTRFFRTPRSNRIINVAFAVLLIVSVGLALLL